MITFVSYFHQKEKNFHKKENMCFCNKDLNILYIVTYFEYGISSKVIAEYVFTFLPTIRYWETKEKQYELCQTVHEIRIGTCTKSIYSNYLFIGNNIFQKFSEYDGLYCVCYILNANLVLLQMKKGISICGYNYLSFPSKSYT